MLKTILITVNAKFLKSRIFTDLKLLFKVRQKFETNFDCKGHLYEVIIMQY